MDTVATEQLSDDVGVPSATPVASHAALAFVVTFAGALIVGALLSSTTTVCVAVVLLPLPSTNVHVIV